MNKTKLKIGYRDFMLTFVKKIDGQKSLGECVYPDEAGFPKGKIRVKKGFDGVEKANVILHEIIHALCYTQGLDLAEKTEERIVCALTNGLIAFARDNLCFFMRLVKLAIKS